MTRRQKAPELLTGQSSQPPAFLYLILKMIVGLQRIASRAAEVPACALWGTLQEGRRKFPHFVPVQALSPIWGLKTQLLGFSTAGPAVFSRGGTPSIALVP